MANQHVLGGAKPAGQFFDAIHRAMLATGATECHSQIAAVLLQVAGQPGMQEVADMVDQPVD